MNYVSECTTASPTTIMNCITHIYIYMYNRIYFCCYTTTRSTTIASATGTCTCSVARARRPLARAPAQSRMRADCERTQRTQSPKKHHLPAGAGRAGSTRRAGAISATCCSHQVATATSRPASTFDSMSATMFTKRKCH